MSVSAITISNVGARERPWLWSRRWDLTWISFSVILVAAPYAVYLLLLNLGVLLEPVAATLGTTVDDMSRNVVNFSVALMIGGPHMYATFTRTALDHDFSRAHRKFLISSLIIPVIVTTLALANLTLLLTIFFFWASIHVLHQIIYVTNLYNQRQRRHLAVISKFADYAVILTSLYPLAAWKIANNKFAIGQNNLSEQVNQILGIVGLSVGQWMVWLAGGAFAISLTVWVAKSIVEYREGILHKPKTVFIGLTVAASFMVPALGNLDTAFQGMNVWHSFQYLALTWMLNHLRQKEGQLEDSPFVERLSEDGSARRFYLFNIGLTIADVGLALVIFVVLYRLVGFSFDDAFDRSYYIAVLSFLWMHYYHDHFLFMRPGVIEGKPIT